MGKLYATMEPIEHDDYSIKDGAPVCTQKRIKSFIVKAQSSRDAIESDGIPNIDEPFSKEQPEFVCRDITATRFDSTTLTPSDQFEVVATFIPLSQVL